MKKKSVWLVLVSASALMCQGVFACPSCQYEVCIGACFCVPNSGGCLPPPPQLERFQFCNVTPNPPGKPSCNECSSIFSGDVGKADCLVRHQGDHVDSGSCMPAACGAVTNLAMVIRNPFLATLANGPLDKNAPKMHQARDVVIEKLDTTTRPVSALALLTQKDGKNLDATMQ